jgi:hypothetical protein
MGFAVKRVVFVSSFGSSLNHLHRYPAILGRCYPGALLSGFPAIRFRLLFSSPKTIPGIITKIFDQKN